jgi:hypothetical protein
MSFKELNMPTRWTTQLLQSIPLENSVSPPQITNDNYPLGNHQGNRQDSHRRNHLYFCCHRCREEISGTLSCWISMRHWCTSMRNWANSKWDRFVDNSCKKWAKYSSWSFSQRPIKTTLTLYWISWIRTKHWSATDSTASTADSRKQDLSRTYLCWVAICPGSSLWIIYLRTSVSNHATVLRSTAGLAMAGIVSLRVWADNWRHSLGTLLFKLTWGVN